MDFFAIAYVLAAFIRTAVGLRGRSFLTVDLSFQGRLPFFKLCDSIETVRYEKRVGKEKPKKDEKTQETQESV